MTTLDRGLKPEIKKRWTEALRSGDYRQTQGVLRRSEQDCNEFCCLGVLCDLVDPSHWLPHTSAEFGLVMNYGDSFEFPPFDVLDAAGLTDSQARELSAMNDEGASFEAIAQAIDDEF